MNKTVEYNTPKPVHMEKLLGNYAYSSVKSCISIRHCVEKPNLDLS